MSDLSQAVDIAMHVHRDQLDKQGQPYIGHPLRVMAWVAPDDDAMCVGVLHDVIEDGGPVAHDLVRASQKGWTTRAVEILTRRKSESYPAYIRRVTDSEDQLAIRVKIADLTDNLDERRGPIADSLRQRYQAAIVALRPCLQDARSASLREPLTTEDK